MVPLESTTTPRSRTESTAETRTSPICTIRTKTDTLEAGRELNNFGLAVVQCEHVCSHPTTGLVNALLNPGNNRKVSSGVTSHVQLCVVGIYDRVETMASDDVLQWDQVQ